MNKVPARIQIWQNGVKMEVRGWLKEFTADVSTIEATADFGSQKVYLPSDRDYKLSMLGGSWKFEHGKPQVEFSPSSRGRHGKSNWP